MEIVVAGFDGERNSSKILIDTLPSNYKKIYLKNDKLQSVHQIKDILNNKTIVFAFGQKPLIKDKIFIEIKAKLGNQTIYLNYPVANLSESLKDTYDVKISENAGSSYCNNLYFEILSHIKQNKLKDIIFFLHIPVLKNISDFNKISKAVELMISNLTRLQP